MVAMLVSFATGRLPVHQNDASQCTVLLHPYNYAIVGSGAASGVCPANGNALPHQPRGCMLVGTVALIIVVGAKLVR
jgi:hypothetical protein